MPKLKKEYMDSRKKEIIGAAWMSFMEKGYEKTTIREIAKRMDASTGIIYNYFKSKEEIIKEMQGKNREIIQYYYEELRKKETAREMLMDLFHITIRFQHAIKSQTVKQMKNKSRGWAGVLAEALRKEEIRKQINSYFNLIEKYISGIIEFGIKNGEINADVNPKTMAGMIVALRWGLAMQTAISDKKDIKSYREDIAKMLMTNIWKVVQDKGD
jgi:AcrR family transcriptional regulator